MAKIKVCACAARLDGVALGRPPVLKGIPEAAVKEIERRWREKFGAEAPPIGIAEAVTCSRAKGAKAPDDACLDAARKKHGDRKDAPPGTCQIKL